MSIGRGAHYHKAVGAWLRTRLYAGTAVPRAARAATVLWGRQSIKLLLAAAHQDLDLLCHQKPWCEPWVWPLV